MAATRLTRRALARRSTPQQRVATQRDDDQGVACPECGTPIRVVRSGRLASHSPGGFLVNQARGYLRCPGSDSDPGQPRSRRPSEPVTVEEARTRGLATRSDLAARYSLSESGVAKWGQQAGYPKPVGKARTATGAWALVWDVAKVDAFYRRKVLPWHTGEARVRPVKRPQMRLVLRHPGPAATALGWGTASAADATRSSGSRSTKATGRGRKPAKGR